MAISILEKRKKLKLLIPILAAIVLATGIIIWQGFFGETKITTVFSPQKTPEESGKIKINWGILQNPRLENLVPFEGILPLKGEAGRQNPFLSY